MTTFFHAHFIVNNERKQDSKMFDKFYPPLKIRAKFFGGNMRTHKATPTPEQIEFLESRGIVIPETQAAAGSLIECIVEGNFIGGATKEERIDTLKYLQTRWLKKEVEEIGVGRLATIIHLSALSKERIIFKGRARRLTIENVFDAYIEWRSGKTERLPLSRFKILDPPPSD